MLLGAGVLLEDSERLGVRVLLMEWLDVGLLARGRLDRGLFMGLFDGELGLAVGWAALLDV